MSQNTFNSLSKLALPERSVHVFQLDRLPDPAAVKKLPFCMKVLLENLLRNEDGVNVDADAILAVMNWANAQPEPDSASESQQTSSQDLAFSPARVVLQDFTGVPAVVDLAAMRDAITELGGDAEQINPLVPVDLVIDHSVMVDYFGDDAALQNNIAKEFERNQERYAFLRWGQQAFRNFRVVPPGTGIVHQVNLEYLANVVTESERDGSHVAYPDSLVGTDSHTTMINGLGVVGWGVGGIEAEAAMLGQPLSLLLPTVVGVKLTGQLSTGVTATDMVLRVTEMLRNHGVVGKFVEFYGDGLDDLTLADRATIANMAPEYGATMGIFPIDQETLKYLQLTGRSAQQITLVEQYAKRQGMWREPGESLVFSEYLELDLSSIQPSLAGPKRPQDRVLLADVPRSLDPMLAEARARRKKAASDAIDLEDQEIASAGEQPTQSTSSNPEFDGELRDGDVVIAAITSCTNTSNPSVMLAAGLVAKKACELGLRVKPWVKTSLAPGSQVVPAYLDQAGLSQYLDQLGFNLVGFGCTTCIGNSGPLDPKISRVIQQQDLVVGGVLSGNRNFEGRIHADVRANYLASPPLVVAYALAGSLMLDLNQQPLGQSSHGDDVYLRDIWPSAAEVNELLESAVSANLYQTYYADVFRGSQQWRAIDVPNSQAYTWPESTYIKQPPFFSGITPDVQDAVQIEDARCLVKVGDSITTDHISPAGSIDPQSPAGRYLHEQGVAEEDFNSLGSRRGNHEVMMRGTFANVRLRNELANGKVGGFTRSLPDGEILPIYDAAMRYQQQNTALIVLAGKEYGTGSSRDWAAKGTQLLGVKAVIAESFERIHRSNLVGFGVLPLQFVAGQNSASLGLTGEEIYSLTEPVKTGAKQVELVAKTESGTEIRFSVGVRIDTATEWEYFQNQGILHTVLRKLAQA